MNSSGWNSSSQSAPIVLGSKIDHFIGPREGGLCFVFGFNQDPFYMLFLQVLSNMLCMYAFQWLDHATDALKPKTVESERQEQLMSFQKEAERFIEDNLGAGVADGAEVHVNTEA